MRMRMRRMTMMMMMIIIIIIIIIVVHTSNRQTSVVFWMGRKNWPIPTCFHLELFHIKTWSYLVACSPPKLRIWFMYDDGLVVKYWVLYFNIFRYYSPYAILIVSPMIVCYPASNSYLDPENSQSLKSSSKPWLMAGSMLIWGRGILWQLQNLCFSQPQRKVNLIIINSQQIIAISLIWIWVNTYRYHFWWDEHPFPSYFGVH